MSERPELRIGDQEREAAVAALGEHYAAGRLTKDEFDERSERAWVARTNAQLAPLFVDLPAPHGFRRPEPARPAGPARPQYRLRWPGGLTVLAVLMCLMALAMVFRFVPWPLFLVLGFLWFKGSMRPGGHRPPHR